MTLTQSTNQRPIIHNNMKLLELHILQSFPVSCLNRDDLNSPKTAIFGGVQRARVSSQCWKREIRLRCQVLDQDKFKGQRSRQIISEITKRLGQEGNNAEPLALCLAHYLAKLDPKNPGKVKTISYYSQGELERFASVISKLKDEEKKKLIEARNQVDMTSLAQDVENDAEEPEEENKPKKTDKKEKGEKKKTAEAFGKLVSRIIKPALKNELKDSPLVKDAADIALFGRMVAADHSLTLEGAAMFSHALSTHKSDNEIDFFTAVSDLPGEDAGSDHMGTTEFNAATYYRYAAVNLSMLADKDHLASMTKPERKAVLDAFIRATLEAVPSARRNSQNANVRPAYVLGIVKDKGQPIQLINAFEKPVFAGKTSILESSIQRLKEENTKLKDTWAIATIEEVAIPDVNINEFITRLTAHAL